jgi:hypothetical protein
MSKAQQEYIRGGRSKVAGSLHRLDAEIFGLQTDHQNSHALHGGDRSTVEKDLQTAGVDLGAIILDGARLSTVDLRRVFALQDELEAGGAASEVS